jgi:dihydrofolate reductase
MAAALFLIVARADDGTIGDAGTLAWHIPADLKRFKALTMGKPMIMGRKTFDRCPASCPAAAISCSRATPLGAPGAEVVHTVKAALDSVADEPRRR